MQELRIPSDNGRVSLSCSFGVSTWTGPDDVAALIKRADVALYEAKTSGRNRVVAPSDDTYFAKAS